MDILKKREQRRYDSSEREDILAYDSTFSRAEAIEDHAAKNLATQILSIPSRRCRCPELDVLDSNSIYSLKAAVDSLQKAPPCGPCVL